MAESGEQPVQVREPSGIDWDDVLGRLQQMLRLRTTPIGMKLFETVAEMEAVPRIRRPDSIHTTDQIVGQAARNGWTVGITVDDLVGVVQDSRTKFLRICGIRLRFA